MSSEMFAENVSPPLSGIRICVTNVNGAEEQEVRGYCRVLGAEFQENLNKNTTYLIAKRVGRLKYSMAKEKWKIPVLNMSWLKECFDKSDFVPTDSYRVGPLYGLVICSTQLPVEERDELINTVERAGGTFNKDLSEELVTHLVALSPEGNKYKAAKSWRINVISPKWIDECIAQDRWLPEQPHMITDSMKYNAETGQVQQRTVTRERDGQKLKALEMAKEVYAARGANNRRATSSSANSSTASAMLLANKLGAASIATSSIGPVNEGLPSNQQGVGQGVGTTDDAYGTWSWSDLPHPKHISDEYRHSLRGHTIYVAGFTPPQMDYIIALCAISGCVRQPFLSHAVSLVILGAEATDEVISQVTKLDGPAVCADCVRIEWFIEQLSPGYFGALQEAYAAVEKENLKAKQQLAEETALKTQHINIDRENSRAVLNAATAEYDKKEDENAGHVCQNVEDDDLAKQLLSNKPRPKRRVSTGLTRRTSLTAKNVNIAEEKEKKILRRGDSTQQPTVSLKRRVMDWPAYQSEPQDDEDGHNVSKVEGRRLEKAPRQTNSDDFESQWVVFD